MLDRKQERSAIALVIESVRTTRSVELASRSDNTENFPDFILSNRTTNSEIWVQVVQVVGSAELSAAEHSAQWLYQATAREYRT
jgi:hypothetical protein